MLVADIFGEQGLIIVVILLVVVFGGSKLPKIARNVGSAGREFRKGQQEAEEEAQAQAKAESAPQPPAPQPLPAAPQAPVASQAPSDAVTISKADLEALLEERLGKGNTASN
jgi:sec-independent protein translocase protein TatA